MVPFIYVCANRVTTIAGIIAFIIMVLGNVKTFIIVSHIAAIIVCTRCITAARSIRRS